MPCGLHDPRRRDRHVFPVVARPRGMAWILVALSMSPVDVCPWRTDMRHAAHAPVTRHARRWRRMRARLGFAALWAALLVWVLGASVRVPGEEPASPEVARHAVVPADLAQNGLAQVDLERAAAWPAESADASPSHEPVHATSHEPTPEQDAALYIAGR
jgi:hypothetical protein